MSRTSDEQLAAIEADVNHVYDTLKLWPTIRRLLAERDEARRVARVLAQTVFAAEKLAARGATGSCALATATGTRKPTCCAPANGCAPT